LTPRGAREVDGLNGERLVRRAGRRVPSHGRSQQPVDIGVEAHVVAFRRLRERTVEALRHAQEQLPAVRTRLLRLWYLAAGGMRAGDPLSERVGDPSHGLGGRRTTRLAAGKLLDRGAPWICVVFVVPTYRNPVRQTQVVPDSVLPHHVHRWETSPRRRTRQVVTLCTVFQRDRVCHQLNAGDI
jgi:hypothetical protein